MMVKKVLSGHYSPETAYIVDDYPYGFRLRCKIRYWLDVNKKGTRLCSQTTNPKRGDVWNKPNLSTYRNAGAMFLDENDHVCWNGISFYTADNVRAFLDTYGEGMTEGEVASCKNFAGIFEGRKANEERKDGYGTDFGELP